MREIKFRAWDSKRKVMFSPHDLYDISSCMLYCTTDGKYKTPNITPMQFTGLIDKNGKEIYSGDILTFKSNSWLNVVIDRQDLKDRMFPIWWDENNCSWWVGDLEDGFKPDKKTDDNQFEIVGNVYEHPELKLEKT